MKQTIGKYKKHFVYTNVVRNLKSNPNNSDLQLADIVMSKFDVSRNSSYRLYFG